MRKRSRTGVKLSLSEKITIVHQALCLKYLYKDIAKEHRITGAYVTFIVKKVLKNPKFIDELVSSHAQRQEV